jgi:hypothetical protein
MSIPLSQESGLVLDAGWWVNEDLTQRLDGLPTDAALAVSQRWRARLGKRRRFR